MSYSIKPEEHELREARRTVQGALETCKTLDAGDTILEVNLSWTEDPFVKEEMNGVEGYTPSPSVIQIGFNSGVEGWKNMLKATVAQEYAHVLSHENTDRTFNWQDILFEAHAQHFAEKVFPDIETPWRKHVPEDEIAGLWSEARELMGDEIDEQRPLFFGNDTFPRWYGYSLAFRIGEKLLEEHELDDLPELKRSDVLEAGDELFD